MAMDESERRGFVVDGLEVVGSPGAISDRSLSLPSGSWRKYSNTVLNRGTSPQSPIGLHLRQLLWDSYAGAFPVSEIDA